MSAKSISSPPPQPAPEITPQVTTDQPQQAFQATQLSRIDPSVIQANMRVRRLLRKQQQTPQ